MAGWARPLENATLPTRCFVVLCPVYEAFANLGGPGFNDFGRWRATSIGYSKSTVLEKSSAGRCICPAAELAAVGHLHALNLGLAQWLTR